MRVQLFFKFSAPSFASAIKKRCSNAKETTAAQAKQEVIKQAFQD